MALSLQQPNIKQKFVALLKRFKVSDEVRALTPEPDCEWNSGVLPWFPGLSRCCHWEARFQAPT